VAEPELDLRPSAGGVTLRVRVKPRSSKDRAAGIREGALVLQVAAPPVEGSANAAVIRLLSSLFDRPPSAITLRQGAKGRDKTFHIAGLDVATARARLVERP
jgi:uncharacterized protein (TIGR00251 family)